MRYYLPLLLLLPLFFVSCGKDSCEQSLTYVELTPVFVDAAAFRALPIVLEPTDGLRSPGKMYLYGDLLLINELNRGIHLYDNSDRSAPRSLGYLAIDGNTDFVVRDGILYANQYVDLLALDISDLQNVRLLERTEDVQTPLEVNEAGQIATYYHSEEVTEVVDCDTRQRIEDWGFACRECVFFDVAGQPGAINAQTTNWNNAGENFFSPVASGAGTGGSMARFTVYRDHLYTVDRQHLRSFRFVGSTVEQVGETQVGWDIETIIPHGDYLYIGSETGMFIYAVSDPAAPVQVGIFQHARACDPVYVDGDFAYVTLRDGTRCEGFSNQLDLVDVSDPTAPSLVRSFPMKNPHGLGIAGDDLFVCEGEWGLKAFDISTPRTLDERPLWHAERWFAYDVIPLPGADPVLLVIGDDGFIQLDISDPTTPRLLSTIPVDRP